ncbi:MAG: Asp-tRNA(Asn)/Glu-tRNA(Gln) amidotransferase subunit GatB [Candidatus Marinimicrobia bacterium]|nr:Asp-tRNA(Asn)/Glu-tRNA(Gln) amidotransferase subunit GatB [Candidatus Neomarinimicrobiota bacterium]
MREDYEAVIGLEVHAQLLTKSKIFCSCKNEYGAEPNTNTCPVCLGMPGVLPVLNKKAVEYAIKMGLATNCKIRNFSRFARKNYFYPDLPKGYQISQYDEPLCYNGYIEIRNGDQTKKIRIKRIHLEEDAGKSIHVHGKHDYTLVDYNRCGVPLIEIVTEPDIRSPQEAYLYLTKIKQILEYLEICDCNMEEGSLRCDANISVRKKGETKFGTKTEMKNMNSFRGVEKALEYEINRQIEIIEDGGKVLQQTLLWDEDKNRARVMRTKEEAEDYRYFPEPDLVPLRVDQKWIDELRDTLPELPVEKFKRFKETYGLRDYDIEILTGDKYLAEYYEETVKHINDPVIASKWIQSELLRVLKEKETGITGIKLRPKTFAELLKLVKDGTITGNVGKEIFNQIIDTDESPAEIVKKKGLTQVSDEKELERIVQEVLSENPNEVERYKAGKKNLLGFFMGQVMKKTRGKANPKLASDLLKKHLEG